MVNVQHIEGIELFWPWQCENSLTERNAQPC